ncbi:MAG TPA: TonB-dependent receptor, partial [Puia sp.]|nr:TonB-dependent receptor [Puia sp.]
PGMQRTLNLVGNWLWNRNGRTLRAEGYYKDYRQLVREYAATYDPDAAWRIVPAGEKVDNSGYGYAKGVELFWHDKETIKGFDYWLSYSYIDTKRLYANYPKEAEPDFVARHNLSIVTKYFVDRWQTNFSLTASYASGRPYYDPASPSFLGSRTPPFEDLSLAVGRLATIQKWFTVVYAGVGNITNHHNIFGYRYSYDGTQKYPILPAFYRSVIIGMNISLSRFDKSEL